MPRSLTDLLPKYVHFGAMSALQFKHNSGGSRCRRPQRALRPPSAPTPRPAQAAKATSTGAEGGGPPATAAAAQTVRVRTQEGGRHGVACLPLYTLCAQSSPSLFFCLSGSMTRGAHARSLLRLIEALPGHLATQPIQRVSEGTIWLFPCACIHTEWRTPPFEASEMLPYAATGWYPLANLPPPSCRPSGLPLPTPDNPPPSPLAPPPAHAPCPVRGCL